jgi:arsenate reductase
MLAEFVGVTLFLTAIISAGATFTKPETMNPFHAATLAITLGIAALLTGAVSGGHLNPAVSLYFFSRKEISAVDFIGYVAAQLAGAAAGVSLGEYLHGYNIAGFTTAASTLSAGPAFVGEVLATAGLVLLVTTLIQNKLTHLIPFGLMLWVFAAFNFTPTGAQANPAVTFGLMVDGKLPVASGAQLILAQIVGLLIAVILGMLLTSATAKKKAAAKKK